MAVDNTLGSFSPHQGRIYAAFVAYKNTRVFGIQNPTDNTDIYTVYSDDGGLRWSDPIQLNTDAGVVDGSSGANNNANQGVVTGRAQFQPAIAVDQATGTVVMSWRDSRDDPARSRVATYVTASIDGGNTFNQQVYANPDKTAVDAITGRTVVLGPQADNESGGNPQRDGTFGYGNQMSLAVFNGQVYPVWAGNRNEGAISNGAVVAAHPLFIYYRPMVIAAGPRVVSSTMGPVTGVSKPTSFEIDFDRPIDPNLIRNNPNFGPSFTAANVQVEYHDTTLGSAFKSLYVSDVSPIQPDPANQNDPTQNGVFGYTRFKVTFNPDLLADGTTASGITNYTGTYSYIIAPDNGKTGSQFNAINSPIRRWSVSRSSSRSSRRRQATSISRFRLWAQGAVGQTTISRPRSLTSVVIRRQTVSNITVTVNLNHQNDGDLEIFLVRFDLNPIEFTLLYFKPSDTNQNLINVTFSDAASQSINTAPGPYTNGTYQPANPLAQLDGVPVDGEYTLWIDDFQPGNTGVLNSWSMTINSVEFSTTVQNGARWTRTRMPSPTRTRSPHRLPDSPPATSTWPPCPRRVRHSHSPPTTSLPRPTIKTRCR